MRAVKAAQSATPQPRRRSTGAGPRARATAYVRTEAARRRPDPDDEDAEDNAGQQSMFAGWLDHLKQRLGALTRTLAVLIGFFGTIAVAGVITGDHMPAGLTMAYRAVSGVVAASGLTVKDVNVVGLEHADKVQVRQAIDLAAGTSMLDVDVIAIRERLEKISWVRSAEVRRVWPVRVEVLIVERRPVALWQSGQQVTPIDREGRRIEGADAGAFASLLLVVGPGAPEHAQPLIDTLARFPAIAKRVTAAQRVGQRRWNLRLDNGVEVRLPEEDAEAALRYLVTLDGEQQILARDLNMIDLRFADRLIVKVPETSPLSSTTPAIAGKDT